MSASVERGKRAKFVKPFRVHDFLDQTIEKGEVGTVFWCGISRNSRGGYYVGIAVDDRSVRVFVDEDFLKPCED